MHTFQSFEDRLGMVYHKLPGCARHESLLTRLYYHVFKLLDERFNAPLSEFGLTTSTFSALMLLYADPDNAISPSALSLAMVSSRTNITRVADELERKGWLERRAHPEDRRRVYLSLTPAGSELVERIVPLQREHLEDLWATFSKREKAGFERLLRKMIKALAEDCGTGDQGVEP